MPYPVANMRTVLTYAETDKLKMARRISQTIKPKAISRPISPTSRKMCETWKVLPVISTSARATAMVNRMMTTTSMRTVTPSTIWVNGPRARSSLITANADDGERATIIVPPIKATATMP